MNRGLIAQSLEIFLQGCNRDVENCKEGSQLKCDMALTHTLHWHMLTEEFPDPGILQCGNPQRTHVPDLPSASKRQCAPALRASLAQDEVPLSSSLERTGLFLAEH